MPLSQQKLRRQAKCQTVLDGKCINGCCAIRKNECFYGTTVIYESDDRLQTWDLATEMLSGQSTGTDAPFEPDWSDELASSSELTTTALAGSSTGIPTTSPNAISESGLPRSSMMRL